MARMDDQLDEKWVTSTAAESLRKELALMLKRARRQGGLTKEQVGRIVQGELRNQGYAARVIG
jgi:hypothetical protein